MWSYRQPGFALHLLHQLQKQQRAGLHCDTLLQTEGVSVPVHSCVLSALSPVFSRALTNSPSLPLGHSRLVKLQAVHAHALLKLVGFLYSGEIDVGGLKEQEEVVDIAHKLGFSNLIDGLKRHITKQQEKIMRLAEIGLDTEVTKRETKDTNVQRKRFTNSETQTDCPEPTVSKSDNLAFVPGEYSTSSEAVGLHLMKDIAASSHVSEALNPVHSKCCQQMQEENKRPNLGHLRQICQSQKLNGAQSKLLKASVLNEVKEVRGKDFRKLVEKLGFQSGSSFRQQNNTHISLKIKLKRRRRGAPWEIVSVQEETGLDGSSASGSGHPSPGKTQKHIAPLRNCPEVLLSPSPTVPRQGLTTITLTPPSDLTMSPPATPGVLQAEESDEHFARLLEDMVMLGLNILPTAPIKRNSDWHYQKEKLASSEPHLEPKKAQCDTVATAPCFIVHDHSLGLGGPDVRKTPPSAGAQGKSGAKSAGHESQSISGTAELKDVTSAASRPTLLASPCAASQRDVDASFMLHCPVPEKVLLSSLPFGPKGLDMPHQNVGDLKNALDSLFWTADDYVQSGNQIKSNTSEGHHGNLQTSGAATSSTVQDALDRVSTVTQNTSDAAISAAGKQCPENEPQDLIDHLPHMTHQETGSAGGTDLNEMRIPRCLSPLVSEEGETDGFTQYCFGPVTKSSAISVTLKPAFKHKISSPQPPSVRGTADQQNQTCTALYVTQKTPSSNYRSELSSCDSCSVRDHMEVTSKGIVGQEMRPILKNQMFGDSKDTELDRELDGSGDRRITTKRQKAGAVINEVKIKKRKMPDSDAKEFDAQTVKIMKPSSAYGEAVEGISGIQLGDYPCSRKIYWLRAGYTANRVSKSQKSRTKLKEIQSNKSVKKKDKDKCSSGIDKEQPALHVAKRGRGRPPKEKEPVAGFVPNLHKERALDSSSAALSASTCSGKDDLQLPKSSETNNGCVQNEEHDMVQDETQTIGLVAKRGPGRPTKDKDQALGLAQTANNLNDEQSATFTISASAGHPDGNMTNWSENNKARGPEIQNASVEFEEVIADLNLNKEEVKQPNVDASQAKKNCIVDQVFHQTIFSVGTGRFPPIGQKMRSSLLNTENSPKTERKRSTDPPLPDIIKKFRNLPDQGHVRGGKVALDDNERKEKESPGKGKMETRVKVTDKAIMVDSKDRFNSNHLKMLSKNENFLTDENSETELGRNQADIGITSIHLDLPTHKTCLYNIPLASSNSEMENDSQSKSAKMSVSIEETLDWAQDLHLKKRANTHIVHAEANQVWTNEKVKGNAEMEAVHVVEIPRKNGKRFLAEINDVEVKIMEESSVVAADHGEEAHTSDSTTDKTDVEGGLSSFAMTNRESVAYEEELRGPQLLRTVVELVSSDEAFTHTDSPAITAEEQQRNNTALSDLLGEKPKQTNVSSTLFSTMDLPTPVSAGESTETEAQECDEDEEIVVDDLLSSPGILLYSSSVRESIAVLTEEEGDLEEEDVDVIGEDTNYALL